MGFVACHRCDEPYDHLPHRNDDGLFGHVLIDLMKMGTRTFCVEPRITWPGAQPGNLTVQLLPGTDTALALALIGAIVPEEFYDHDFVIKWCRSFEQLANRAAEYPAEKIADICGVEAEIIRIETNIETKGQVICLIRNG